MKQSSSKKTAKEAVPVLAFGEIKLFVLWAVILTVCLISLSSLYYWFWKDRIDYGRLDECQLVADTAAQYVKADQVKVNDSRYIDESLVTKMVVTLGWGAVYGDLNAEKIQDILHEEYFTLDELAVWSNGEYRAIIGDLEEDEFHQRSDKMYKESMTEGEWLPDAAPGVKYDSSQEADASWISCRFHNTGYEILAKISDDLYFKNIEDTVFMEVDELMEYCNIPRNGGLICVDRESGKVTAVKGDLDLSPGDELTQKPDEEGFLTIANRKCIAAQSQTDQYRFIAAIPVGVSRWMRVISPVALAVFYTVLLFISILYAYYLREDILLGRTAQNARTSDVVDLKKNYRKRVRLMYMTMTVLISLLVILTSAISIVDHTRMRMKGLLDDSFDYFSYASEGEASMVAEENNARLKIANVINQVIEEDPSLANDAALDDLAFSLTSGIFLIDSSGEVIAAGAIWDDSYPFYNLSGLTKEDDDWDVLKDVLNGEADGQSAVVKMDDYILHMSALQLPDRSGMLLLAFEQGRSSISESVYSNFTMSEGRILFAADLGTNKIVSCSDESYIGDSTDDFGMTKASMKSEFFGTLQLKPGKYFCVTHEYDGILTSMGVNVRYILDIYFLVILLTVAAGILVTAFLLFLTRWLQKEYWSVNDIVNTDVTQEEEDDGRFYETDDDSLHEQVSANERWTNTSIPFSRKHADEKIKTVISCLILIVMVCLYAIPGYSNSTGDWKETFLFLLSKKWVYGFNIYAITYSVLVMLLILILARIMKRIVLLIGNNYGTRGITVAKLIDSFIRYMAILGGIAYTLTFLGVDTTTILASVGIVGLGLSLGAKDLVTDIIAGIGIVFEGEFRNGDIVDIGGYRGTVIDIGVRTTKILADNNVKIFRNSMVSGVINMTQRHSIATVNIQVSRSEPLEKVEKIFLKELPRIRKRIPDAGDEICLLGVVDMTVDQVTLCVTLTCEEENRNKVIRGLYREINLMIEREGLKVKG